MGSVGVQGLPKESQASPTEPRLVQGQGLWGIPRGSLGRIFKISRAVLDGDGLYFEHELRCRPFCWQVFVFRPSIAWGLPVPFEAENGELKSVVPCCHFFCRRACAIAAHAIQHEATSIL